MGQTILLHGIVLSATPMGEYDKRLVILTSERGKITAFARGARRPNSSLLAGTNPFAFGEFELYEGKNYNVCKISIRNYFRELVTDLDKAYIGFYFLELADYYSVENQEAKDVCNLLYLALTALKKDNFDNRLVRRIYELRMLVINGEYPNVFSCMNCGKTEALCSFHVKRGGMLCESCASVLGGRRLGESTIFTLQYIEASPLKELFTFEVKEEVLMELEKVMDAYMNCYVAHHFRSLDLL